MIMIGAGQASYQSFVSTSTMSFLEPSSVQFTRVSLKKLQYVVIINFSKFLFYEAGKNKKDLLFWCPDGRIVQCCWYEIQLIM
jgi:hypothetical protein